MPRPAAAVASGVSNMQLRYCGPTDLVCLICAMQKLQLQPPSGWLLQHYSASQDQLQRFTDLQLASLTATLDKLLQQQQQQQHQGDAGQPAGESAQQQQLQPWQQLCAAAAVPPAVWQLQLEVELRSRYRNSRNERQSRGSSSGVISSRGRLDELLQRQQQHREEAASAGDADDTRQAARQQQEQQYEPLWVVGGVLRRWRLASVTGSWESDGMAAAAAAADGSAASLLHVV
jgi:hypothetical protein